MIFKLFRRSPNQPLIDRLHGEIMAQARQPAFFLEYGVADTPEGRFELVAIHVLMAVRRLNALPPPAADVSRDLTDCMFRHFDIAFREMGVGDISVPKRMKKYAQNWLGRAQVYGKALEAEDAEALAGALTRNVYGREAGEAPEAGRLARYMIALQTALQETETDDFLAARLPSVSAESVA